MMKCWAIFRNALAFFNFFHFKNDSPDVLNDKGKELFRNGCFDEALACFDAALVIRPTYVAAHVNRGAILKSFKQPEAALESFDTALAIEPGHVNALYNKGLTQLEMNFAELALENFDAVLLTAPEFFEARNARGVALAWLNRLEDALVSFDAALAIQPCFVEAWWNKSLFLLLGGEYAEGWKLYEWRWQRDEMKGQQRFKERCWLGEVDIFGKNLLVYSEQGLGDFIQFCRYALVLKAIGVNVIIEVPEMLLPIISMMHESFNVVERGWELPSYDYQCPVMSLPLALRTDVGSIPAKIPYLFANKIQIARWQKKLPKNNKPRIGIVWSGSAIHNNDRNRSIPFALLETVFDLPLDFHCLQKEFHPSDENMLSESNLVKIYPEELNDFSDTAGLLEAMDLIISVDTSVAHLAGAMGKPVWILLPFMPDFRWMLERTDSPWYPTAILIRQPKIGDWQSVISEVEIKLRLRFLH